MLLIVTDNSSNIVKAVRLLRDRSQEQREDGSWDQPGDARDGLDELYIESESEETDEEDEETGDVGKCGYSAKYVLIKCLNDITSIVS